MNKLKIAFGALLAVFALTLTAPAQAGSKLVAHGTFKGENKHITTGGVSILKTASGYLVVLEADFELDGAPAPTIRFGNNGKGTSKQFSKLVNKKGHQIYTVPAGINPKDFNEFYIWCKKFDVSLGVAKLK